MKKLKPQARRHLIGCMARLAAEQARAGTVSTIERRLDALRRSQRVIMVPPSAIIRVLVSRADVPDPLAAHHAAFERGLRRSRS